MEMESSTQTNENINDHIKAKSWVKRLYIAGSGMIGIGTLNNKNQNGWEIPVGFSLILIAYCYEQFIARSPK